MKSIYLFLVSCFIVFHSVSFAQQTNSNFKIEQSSISIMPASTEVSIEKNLISSLRTSFKKDFENSIYIVFLSFTSETERKDLKEVKIYNYLFENGEKVKGTSIYDRKDVKILLIGDVIFDKGHIKIEEKKSAFETSMSNFWDLFKTSVSITKTDAISLQYTKYDFYEDQIDLPFETIVTLKDTLDINSSFKEISYKYKFSEENIFLFKVGVQGFSKVKKVLQINNGSINVSEDNYKKEDFTGDLTGFIEVHLPRDPENFNPTLTNWSKHNIDRLGLLFGMSLTKNPLDAFYFGLNVSLTNELGIMIGLTWQNVYDNQVQTIGSINSLDDAKDFLRKSYTGKIWTAGITFNPLFVLNKIK